MGNLRLVDVFQYELLQVESTSSDMWGGVPTDSYTQHSMHYRGVVGNHMKRSTGSSMVAG